MGYYADGLIWSGGERGNDYEAVGAYQGSPVGAIAAALVFLLGGGEESENTSAAETTSSDNDEFSDPASEYREDSYDDDDDDYTADYSPSYTPPPIVEDPPEVIAERRFATAITLEELRAIKLQVVGHLSSEIIDKLYIPRSKEIETRRIDDLISKIKGRTVEQLKQAFDREQKSLSLEDFKARNYSELESYQLYQLASLISDIWNKWSEYELHAFSGWSDKLPSYTILARRRLKEITDKRVEEQATSALATLEPIEQATYDQLTNYFFYHHSAAIAIKAVSRVNDKNALALVYRDYHRFPIGEAVKKRYLEILDAEHALRGLWQKLLYLPIRSRERERVS